MIISFALTEYHCPNCGHKMIQRSKSGQGASYAKQWKTLPENCKKIITAWLSHPDLRDNIHEKKHLLARLRTVGLKIEDDPFNARISELLSLGLITMTRHEKSESRYTTKAPKYRLNIEKTTKILNRDGILAKN